MALVARGQRRVGTRAALIAAGVVLLCAVAVRLADPQRVEWVRTYLVIFGSLLVQALPFVMLGALAAALVEVFVPIGTLERLGRLPRPLQLPTAALAGLAFPICECGSVPVARRLAAARADAIRGGHVHARRAGDQSGGDRLDVRRLSGPLDHVDDGGRPVPARDARRDRGRLGGREPHHRRAAEAEPRGGARAPRRSSRRPEARWRRFFVHLGNDFLFMGRYLIARRDDRRRDPDLPARLGAHRAWRTSRWCRSS